MRKHTPEATYLLACIVLEASHLAPKMPRSYALNCSSQQLLNPQTNRSWIYSWMPGRISSGRCMPFLQHSKICMKMNDWPCRIFQQAKRI